MSQVSTATAGNAGDHAERFLQAALHYAGRGWLVFPVRPRGKEPLTQHGLKDASTDPERIEAWWKAQPMANVAIATGKASGIFVVDIDLDHRGFEGVAMLEASNNGGLLTLECATGGGGAHLYFTYPDNAEIRNSAGKLAYGVDIRGEGGYVIAPPSIHKNGQPYYWCEAYKELQGAPAWLLTALAKPTEPPPKPKRPFRAPLPFLGKQGAGYWRKALRSELERLAPTPEGQRHDTLVRSAFRMGQLAHLGTDPGKVVEVLTAAGVQLGLPEAEARRAAQDGFEEGQKHSRQPE